MHKDEKPHGVFHWGRLFSNYGFFEGKDQCLQSRLGLSQNHPNSLSGPWLHPPRNCTAVGSKSDTLPALSYTVTVSSGRTSTPVQYKETISSQAIYTNCPKGNWPAINWNCVGQTSLILPTQGL